jgi:hypothetical protein
MGDGTHELMLLPAMRVFQALTAKLFWKSGTS